MNKGISLDLSKVAPYLATSEVDYMEDMVKCAHDKLHNGTGAGNDFLDGLIYLLIMTKMNLKE